MPQSSQHVLSKVHVVALISEKTKIVVLNLHLFFNCMYTGQQPLSTQTSQRCVEFYVDGARLQFFFVRLVNAYGNRPFPHYDMMATAFQNTLPDHSCAKVSNYVNNQANWSGGLLNIPYEVLILRGDFSVTVPLFVSCGR